MTIHDPRSPGSTRGIFFDFNIKDQDDFSLISIWHSSTPTAPVGYLYYDGRAASTVSGTQNVNHVVTRGDDDTLHVRVQWDGYYVKVFQAASAASLGAVCEADNWCYRSGSFPLDGGWFGFHNSTTEDGVAYVDDVVIRRKDGENWKTEFEERFEIDGSGCGAQQLTHDKAGNLTYDGLYRYTFDAWNRLSTVSRAFRYDNGTLETASKIATMRYDGLGRRIQKSIQNSGDWDCTYRSYYDGQSLVELQNGGGFVLQQFVWGTQYVDELVQIAVNGEPCEDPWCELFYWALQDANYNVLGVVDAEGTLVERYEYTPYGERQVYRSAGSNDPRCHARTIESRRCEDGWNVAPYSLCDFGHQGLLFDKVFGLVYNRARYYHPRLMRMISTDPKGYVDGMNLYEYVGSNPGSSLDPSGTDRLEVEADVDPDDPDKTVLNVYYVDEWSACGYAVTLGLGALFGSDAAPVYLGRLEFINGEYHVRRPNGRYTSMEMLKAESDAGGTNWEKFDRKSTYALTQGGNLPNYDTRRLTFLKEGLAAKRAVAVELSGLLLEAWGTDLAESTTKSNVETYAGADLSAEVAKMLLETYATMPFVLASGVRNLAQIEKLHGSLRHADRIRVTEKARQRGMVGERLAGIRQGNKARISINGRVRIPDAVTKRAIVEVKNVKKLSYTAQIRDYVDYARRNGKIVELWVRGDTILSTPLQEAVFCGDIVLQVLK